jgi:hypothetical protein
MVEHKSGKTAIYKHHLYKRWSGIKRRCYNKNYAEYYLYGGRGIRICEEWLHDPRKFISDMAPSYIEGLTLDRIDPDGDYSPINCRWATQRQQQNNRRDNKVILYNGCSLTLAEWARKLSIKYSTMTQRYYVYKWSLDKLLGDRK